MCKLSGKFGIFGNVRELSGNFENYRYKSSVNSSSSHQCCGGSQMVSRIAFYIELNSDWCVVVMTFQNLRN